MNGDGLGAMLGSLVLLAAIGVAIFVFAFPEQWLRYRVEQLGWAGNQTDVAECITRNSPAALPAGSVDNVAVVRACRSRYSAAIPFDYLRDSVSGTLGPTSATLSNRGRDWIVTEVTVAISSRPSATPTFHRVLAVRNTWVTPDTGETWIYPELPPDVRERLRMIDGEWNFTWHVVSAKGIRFAVR